MICAWRVYTRNIFSYKIWGAQDKTMAHGLVGCSFKFKLSFEFEWPTNHLYPPIWCTNVGCGKAFAWEKIHEKLLLVNSNEHRRSEVAQGVEVKVVSDFKPT